MLLSETGRRVEEPQIRKSGWEMLAFCQSVGIWDKRHVIWDNTVQVHPFHVGHFTTESKMWLFESQRPCMFRERNLSLSTWANNFWSVVHLFWLHIIYAALDWIELRTYSERLNLCWYSSPPAHMLQTFEKNLWWAQDRNEHHPFSPTAQQELRA